VGVFVLFDTLISTCKVFKLVELSV